MRLIEVLCYDYHSNCNPTAAMTFHLLLLLKCFLFAKKNFSQLFNYFIFFFLFFFFPIYLFSCNLSQVYLILLLGKQKFWRCLVWMFGWDDLHCCTLGRFSFLLVVVCFICLFFPWSHDTGTWAHQPCGFLSTSRWLNKWWIDVPWPTRNMLLSYLCFRTNVYTTKF